eukprot:2472878-Prymnesium_polylepis.2
MLREVRTRTHPTRGTNGKCGAVRLLYGMADARCERRSRMPDDPWLASGMFRANVSFALNTFYIHRRLNARIIEGAGRS